MKSSNNRVYETVHFPEYLDNGTADIDCSTLYPFANKKALLNRQQSLPTVKESKPIAHNETQALTQPDSAQESRNEWYTDNLIQVCSEILGEQVTRLSFPGGLLRKSCRLHLSDKRTLIVSHRLPGRAMLEASILDKLTKYRSSSQALTPQLYAFNGLLLIQQDLPGQVLDSIIEHSNESRFSQLANKTLDSLSQLHHDAEILELDSVVPPIGYSHEWMVKFLDRTAVIGGYTGIPTPFIQADQLFDLLVLFKPRFLKWDARPGNAMLLPDEHIVWFDWEHCAARNRLDDMAWFLCDDKIPDYPVAEDAIIRQHLMYFADGRSFDHAHDYLRLYGVLHMCVRLGRMLDMKGTHSWQQLDQFLKREKPGTSLTQAQRLCTRASRWSAQMRGLTHLRDWFLQVGEYLATMP